MKSVNASAFLLKRKKYAPAASNKVNNKVRAKPKPKDSKASNKVVAAVDALLFSVDQKVASNKVVVALDKAVAALVKVSAKVVASKDAKTNKSTKKKFNGKYRKLRPSFQVVAAAGVVETSKGSAATSATKWPKLPRVWRTTSCR